MQKLKNKIGFLASPGNRLAVMNEAAYLTFRSQLLRERNAENEGDKKHY